MLKTDWAHEYLNHKFKQLREGKGIVDTYDT